MGGLFIKMKVRKDQKPGDYKDLSWYKHPVETVAFEWTSNLPDPARFVSEGGQTMKANGMPTKRIDNVSGTAAKRN
jgi:manganese oxidase